MSILVATDFSENSYASIRIANQLAKTFEVPLRLMHVVDLTGDDNAWRILYENTEEIEKNASKEAELKLVSIYKSIIPEADQIPFITAVRFGTPADGVEEEVQSDRPILMVVGTVGQSHLKNVFFGRTSNHLVRETDVPLLAVPPEFASNGFKNILVAVDFSECSKLALASAQQLAVAYDANLDLIHAVDVDQELSGLSLSHLMGDMKEEIDSLLIKRSTELKDWSNEAGATRVNEYHIKGIRPDAAIEHLSEEGEYDLIVMGTHGRRGFARWFLGSTAERVLRKTRRPVLVVSATDAGQKS